MSRKQYIWVAMLMLAGFSGCAMCDNAHDSSYAAFGGKWQRDNPYSGRVASAFDPAGMQVLDSRMPMEAEPPMEIMEEDEEIVEPLLDEAEAESAELETPGMPAGESDATSGDDKEPAAGVLELPDMPGEPAKSQPSADDGGLLPPLEAAP